ncbi:MAG: hypothetical protein ACXAC8_14585 [Candidatus Hodarchaeales archaeon]
MVKSKDETLAYCLELKIWNEPCPPSCPYFESGEPGNLEVLQEGNFTFDCMKFTRKLSKEGKAYLYCKLLRAFNPLCTSCYFQH